MQRRAKPAQNDRLDTPMPGKAGHEQARAHGNRPGDLAGQGGAARDLARLVSFLRQDALARQPRGQDHQAKRGQVLRHDDGGRREGLPDQRQRGQEQKIDAPARLGPARAPETAAILRCGGLGAGIGAVFAAKALRHHAPPAMAA